MIGIKYHPLFLLGYGYIWIQLCTRKVRLSSNTKIQNPTTNHILYNWVFCSLCDGDSELLSYMALRPGFLNKFDAPRVGTHQINTQTRSIYFLVDSFDKIYFQFFTSIYYFSEEVSISN